MKKVLLQPVFVIALLVFVSSCRKDLEPGNSTINATIKVEYDTTTDGNFNYPLQGISVKLSNLLNGNELTVQTDNQGRASIGGISAGQYSVAATITLPAATYTNITGIPVTEDVVYNASLTSITINSAADNNLSLTLQTGRIGDWVIKQIYFAGSHRTLGALFRDQFIELYNNSNKVLYADSLYIATLIGVNNSSPDLNTGFYLTQGEFAGQFDWNKSLDMPAGINANDDYVYTKSLYRIPGTGTTYPVQPGASIVIAQTAVNHKAPFTGVDGSTVQVQDPSLTVDLSKAEFEVYAAPFLTRPLASDVDVPTAVNLIPLLIFGTDFIIDNPGRDGYAIFKTTADVENAYPRYFAPNVQTPGNQARYFQVPRSVIIDAVETQPSEESSRVPKKLRASLDAGFTFVPAGSYSSQSVVRKTLKTVAGRKVLVDTNNSSTDFTFFNIANPKGFAE
jgi:hypothetical protein